MPGLGATFGRGGATTAQQDLANSDCILIQGSSMAEAHPVGFRWVLKARERGATIIHIDPRFSRTSALADIWAPIRAGSDIVFLGALINHVLSRELYFKEYVLHYTNASCLLREDFIDSEDQGGFFSGWDEKARKYDDATWRYDGPDLGHPRRDPTLQHPRSVFQTLKRHFARYTPEMVEAMAGIPRELFFKVAKALTDASGPEKTAAICYAVGWTQHSTGVQLIRTAGILQLLLGNMGRPGGGIMALRGHASIQGSTDIPTLYDVLPGYLPMPRTRHGEGSLKKYFSNHQRATGLWADFPKYVVSLLKAYYGSRATAANDFGWRWLPRIARDHSHFSFFAEMSEGKVEGFFVMGQNPAVGAQNSRMERKALAKLKWLVVRDLVEIETASFWYASPEVERGELKTSEIGTEVFLFPAAGHAEKAGAFTNTQRLLQWREKAVEPPGDCRSEAWFIHQLARRLQARARESGDPRDEPLRALDWWYPENAHGEPDMENVLAEINGWRVAPEKSGDHHGEQVGGFAELHDDGSTASGCWIYSGVLGPDKINKARGRAARGRYAHGWGYAWPADRRILYNRASARPDGQPWSEAKKLVWWDPAAKKWGGLDVPDFPDDKPPDYRAPEGALGLDAIDGDAPFILHEDGLGWIYVPKGLQDGPLPTHFEPMESPLRNGLYPRETNPPLKWFTRPDNRFAAPGDPRFPYVLTTYRLTEHHTAGGMSRFLSHLAELQPESFAEISPELAAELKIANADWIIVATMRGAVEARALVSRRIRPLRLGEKTVHQVAMPFHWGTAGPVRGDAVNDLIALAGEPNVTIHEGKALLCTVLPGRLPRGPEFLSWMEKLAPAADPVRQHPEQPAAAEAPGGAMLGGQGQHGQST